MHCSIAEMYFDVSQSKGLLPYISLPTRVTNNRNTLIVEGIVVKNRPNIYPSDKRVKFCRDVRFGLLIKKKYCPTYSSQSMVESDLDLLAYEP